MFKVQVFVNVTGYRKRWTGFETADLGGETGGKETTDET